MNGSGVASITCASARVDRTRLAALLSVFDWSVAIGLSYELVPGSFYYGPINLTMGLTNDSFTMGLTRLSMA